jgi:glycerol-3-phosphate dehydrogenase
LIKRYPFLEPAWAVRLVRAYGTDAAAILGDAKTLAECGEHFGHGLTEREVRHMVTREWAQTAEDVLWRRSKLGLRLSADEAAGLEQWLIRQHNGALASADMGANAA